MRSADKELGIPTHHKSHAGNDVILYAVVYVARHLVGANVPQHCDVVHSTMPANCCVWNSGTRIVFIIVYCAIKGGMNTYK